MHMRTLICAVVLLVSCRGGTEHASAGDSAAAEDLKAPAPLTEMFVPTRWGETATTELNPDFKASVRPGDDDGVCIRVIYHPAEEYWGALYWQARKELGVRKPVRLPPGSRITFWARGETGEEEVEFKLPAEPSSELLIHSESTRLGTQWKHYELEIGDRAEKPVTGIFGIRWECTLDRNPRGLTFYLDDLRVE